MINYTHSVSSSAASARVYDDKGNGFSIEAVEVPDMASLIDSTEENIAEALNENTPLRDIAVNLINSTRLELLSELLLKLLLIFQDSTTIKLDIACLVSAAGLPLTDKTDTAVAAEFGLSRQTFSARKKALLKRLNLAPPPHSKNQRACSNYSLTNRTNIKLN